MREAYLINDIQVVFYSLIKYKIDSAAANEPFGDWDVDLGWPTEDKYQQFTKPLIMIESPKLPSQIKQFGGGRTAYESCFIYINAWTDIYTGLNEEGNIIASHLIQLFNNANVHSIKFPITLGGTTYTNQTLFLQGIKIDQVSGPIPFPEETDIKTTRNQLQVNFKVYIN